jgi:hypothetical protein
MRSSSPCPLSAAPPPSGEEGALGGEPWPWSRAARVAGLPPTPISWSGADARMWRALWLQDDAAAAAAVVEGASPRSEPPALVAAPRWLPRRASLPGPLGFAASAGMLRALHALLDAGAAVPSAPGLGAGVLGDLLLGHGARPERGLSGAQNLFLAADRLAAAASAPAADLRRTPRAGAPHPGAPTLFRRAAEESCWASLAWLSRRARQENGGASLGLAELLGSDSHALLALLRKNDWQTIAQCARAGADNERALCERFVSLLPFSLRSSLPRRIDGGFESLAALVGQAWGHGSEALLAAPLVGGRALRALSALAGSPEPSLDPFWESGLESSASSRLAGAFLAAGDAQGAANALSLSWASQTSNDFSSFCGLFINALSASELADRGALGGSIALAIASSRPAEPEPLDGSTGEARPGSFDLADEKRGRVALLRSIAENGEFSLFAQKRAGSFFDPALAAQELFWERATPERLALSWSEASSLLESGDWSFSALARGLTRRAKQVGAVLGAQLCALGRPDGGWETPKESVSAFAAWSTLCGLLAGSPVFRSPAAQEALVSLLFRLIALDAAVLAAELLASGVVPLLARDARGRTAPEAALKTGFVDTALALLAHPRLGDVYRRDPATRASLEAIALAGRGSETATDDLPPYGMQQISNLCAEILLPATRSVECFAAARALIESWSIEEAVARGSEDGGEGAGGAVSGPLSRMSSRL